MKILSYKIAGTGFVSILLVVLGIVLAPEQAQAAECTSRPTNVELQVDNRTVPAGATIPFKVVTGVQNCPAGSTMPAGYKVKTYDSSGEVRAVDMDIPASAWAVDPQSGTRFTYTFAGTMVPFSAKYANATTATYRAQITFPNSTSGVYSTPITFTVGTTPPGNTPGNAPGNSCTGPGCGTVTSQNFDAIINNLNNPINIETFPELVLFVMKGFIFLIGIMAVLIIIIGGVRMVLSQGNQESVTKGKQTVIWAVAGLIVALLSFSIVSIVQNLLSKPGQ